MNDFLQGGLLALHGGILWYCAAFVLAVQKNRKQRAAVANALLRELQVQEIIIRKLSQANVAATRTAPLVVDVHDHFQSDFHLFSPDTISALVELRGFIRDMAQTREEARFEDPVEDSTHGWF